MERKTHNIEHDLPRSGPFRKFSRSSPSRSAFPLLNDLSSASYPTLAATFLPLATRQFVGPAVWVIVRTLDASDDSYTHLPDRGLSPPVVESGSGALFSREAFPHDRSWHPVPDVGFTVPRLPPPGQTIPPRARAPRPSGRACGSRRIPAACLPASAPGRVRASPDLLPADSHRLPADPDCVSADPNRVSADSGRLPRRPGPLWRGLGRDEQLGQFRVWPPAGLLVHPGRLRWRATGLLLLLIRGRQAVYFRRESDGDTVLFSETSGTGRPLQTHGGSGKRPAAGHRLASSGPAHRTGPGHLREAAYGPGNATSPR